MQPRMDMHGGDDPMNVCSHAAMMRSIASTVPPAAQNPHDMTSMWQQPDAFNVQGMPLSLVQALRHAQATQQQGSLQGSLQGSFQMPGSAGLADQGVAPMGQMGQMGQGPLSRFAGYGGAPTIHSNAAAAALSAAVSAAYTANAPAAAAPPVLSQCQPVTSDAMGWTQQTGDVNGFRADGSVANA